MRRKDAIRWCLKTLAEQSDGPGLTSDHVDLTFPTFQSDIYSRMQLRVKTQSFQEGKEKIKQVTRSYQDHHMI